MAKKEDSKKHLKEIDSSIKNVKRNINILKHLFKKDDKFSIEALAVLNEKVLQKRSRGYETPEKMFKRVSTYLASKEKKKVRETWEKAFYKTLSNLDFLPGPSCLANAGTKNKILFQIESPQILDVNSVDIFKIKKDSNILVDNDFMNRVIHDRKHWLRKNALLGRNFQARELFDHICARSRDAPTCLITENFDTANFGSINLTNMSKGQHINWVKLGKTIKIAIRFLDNTITLNKFSSKKEKESYLQSRNIHLGIMGWADLLVNLGISYNSKKAFKLADNLMYFIKKTTEKESNKLAFEKGPCKKLKRRNKSLITIKYDKDLSTIAGCTPGIEPLQSIVTIKSIAGLNLQKINKYFEQISRYQGFYNKNLINKIADKGSVLGIRGIPKSVQRHFLTWQDISLEKHIEIQSKFQLYTDTYAEKALPLTEDATIGDFKRAYMLAWKSGCKKFFIIIK